MIIDIEVKTYKANKDELFIMNLYNHVQWYRFIDKNNQNPGIIDFRIEHELKQFLPDVKLSDFIRSHEMTRLYSRRIHFKNLARKKDKNYSKQWYESSHYLTNWYPHLNGCFKKEYSEKYLKENKPFKLSMIKIVEKK